jgi:predicted nucleic acid-binding protein
MIVVDTNVIAYLLLPGPHTEAVERLRAADSEWVSSPLWRYEFLNVLWAHVRADQVEIAVAEQILSLAFSRLAIVEREPLPQDVFELATQRGLTAYDSQYVSLALTLGGPLYTFDKAILRSCPEEALRPS